MDSLRAALSALVSDDEREAIVKYVAALRSRDERLCVESPSSVAVVNGSCEVRDYARYVFAVRTHLAVQGCLHVTVFDVQDSLVCEHTLTQTIELRAFSGATQDELAASVKEYIQNAQDAVLEESGMQLTGRFGDGSSAALAVLIRRGVDVTIEVRRNVRRGAHFSVDARSTLKGDVVTISNSSQSAFDLSSLVNGMSKKRKAAASDATALSTALLFSTNEPEDDGVSRCETRVTLRFPPHLPFSVDDACFSRNLAGAFDVCRTQMLHVQAKVLSRPGEVRIFETGLYLEHESLPGAVALHVNITRSGARSSSSRDRTFVGFEEVDFCGCDPDGAAKVASALFERVAALGRHASCLLVALSKHVALAWPSGVVPVRDDPVAGQLPDGIRTLVVRDARLRDTFDAIGMYRSFVGSAVPSMLLTEKAEACAAKVGGTVPKIRMLSALGAELTALVEQVPCRSVRCCAGSICVDDAVYVPCDIVPDLIPMLLITFGYIRFFDVLRKTFGMSDTDEGLVLGHKTKCLAQPNECASLNDYFTPFVPIGCGASVKLQPSGDLMYVQQETTLTPREALALPLRCIGDEAPGRDTSPVQAAARRCPSAKDLVVELEARPYGACTIADINEAGLPLQCIARSIMYVMIMRKLGYDAIYLRGKAHSIAMVSCSDGVPIFVECCPRSAFNMRAPARDDTFARLYRAFVDMQARLGRAESERLVIEFLEGAARL